MNRLDSGCPLSRRRLLQLGFTAALPAMSWFHASAAAQGAQDSLAGQGAKGTLRDPSAVGRPRDPTDASENDAEVQAIEQGLACNCGCTLDVFTCRTTDFSCTYSPALHREVLALRDEGKTARQILDAFVAKYGEKALMAPEPRGSFNLAGYLLPGALIAAAGAGLLTFIARRKHALSGPAGEAAGGVPPGAPAASPEELERLRRALVELED
jgi:cytochrome c-type biogenesis protein CcmH